MTVALRSPSTISSVISVDNAPANVPLSSDFEKYVRGMKQIDEANVTKQKEADEILQEYEEVSLRAVPGIPLCPYGLRKKSANMLTLSLVLADSPVPPNESRAI